MFSISIHAPLAGCDLTPPPPDGGITISIHAPLAGCDAGHGRSKHRRGDFNPRTPCGVRHLYTSCMRWPRIFQSTHPLRGATRSMRTNRGVRRISIHAPLAGCDASDHGWRFDQVMISIHAPLAGCDAGHTLPRNCGRISIHAPLAGCDPARSAARPWPI